MMKVMVKKANIMRTLAIALILLSLNIYQSPAVGQVAQSLIAYAIYIDCFTDRCISQLGIFNPITGIETINTYRDIGIEPSSIEWSNDQTRLFLRDGEYSRIFHRSTLEIETLVEAEPALEDFQYAAWAPDDQTIASTVRRAPDFYPRFLSLINVETLQEYLLSDDLLIAGPLDWSPDSESLVFSAGISSEILPDAPPTNETLNALDIYTINAASGGSINLTPGDGGGFAPAWSGANDEIVFVAVEGDSQRIAVIGADGNTLRQFPGESTENETLSFPQWVLNDTQLLYTAYPVERDTAQFRLLDIENGDVEPLITQSARLEFSISPDQTQFAYVGFTDAEQNRDTVLCIFDLTTMTDTCFEDIHPHPFALPAWDE